MTALGLAGARADAAALATAPQDGAGYYPPLLTGLRGSHPGSFEVAHSLRDGTFWQTAPQPRAWRRFVRSGRGRRRYQRACRGAFLSLGKTRCAHLDPGQPRRFRRSRQAERVFDGRPHAAHERRHAGDRFASAIQRGVRRAVAHARCRTRQARGKLRQEKCLSVDGPGPWHLLRSRNLRAGCAGGRRRRKALGDAAGRCTAERAGTRRHRAARGRTGGFSARPVLGREKSAAFPHQLPRFSAACRSRRSWRAALLSGCQPGRMGRGYRRDLRARHLGVRIHHGGVWRAEADTGIGPAYGLHAVGLRRWRVLHVPFPGW